MRRAVVDTSVLISAFLTEEGTSATLLRYVREGAFVLCLSGEIIEELRSRLLYRPRIRAKYRYTDERVHQHCRDLETVARIVADLPETRVVERDPDDDMIVATAVAAQADRIVTRDKDLLSLGMHHNIRIITPRQLHDELAGGG